MLTEDNRRAVVKNGKDSLDICRVVNGMWQTSGGWGQIDRDNAVDAMLKYADAGLTTFDMADICIALNHQLLMMCVRKCVFDFIVIFSFLFVLYVVFLFHITILLRNYILL